MMKLKKIFVTILAVMMFAGSVPAINGDVTSKSSRDTIAPPQYRIFDIGVVQTGDSASQGFGISTRGVAVGRSIRTGGAQAYTWTQGGGMVGFTNLAGRNYCVSNSANDGNSVVGTCSTALSGTGRLPVIWQNGSATQLPLPAGETLGDANHVNGSNVAVGSVNSGNFQRAVIYSGGTGTIITQTTTDGSFFRTAFGINDTGRVVGQGIDPTNAARNVGIVYDIGGNSSFEVGALPNANGALAFGVSNAGHVVGSSMQNQGSGLPFIWTQVGGMTAIPLPTGTTQGSARAVNSAGWAVGTASSAFAIPFLYDGTATYRLADLIPAGTGWDLSTNTSSSALGISDGNVIVGTGVYNGQIHAYAMVPVTNARPKTATCDYDGDGKTDFALRRLQNDQFWWYISLSGDGSTRVQHWGKSGDTVVCGDFDGDSKTDLTVWRSGAPLTAGFYILQSSDNTFRFEQFGQSLDNPTVVGDYDGDGKTDVAVYRNGVNTGEQSYFYYRGSANNPNGSVTYVPWGIRLDRAYTGDFDGDGRGDFAVQRSIDGVSTHFILQSADNSLRIAYLGDPNDSILPGDYNGDGKTDVALLRNENGGRVWYVTTDFGASYAATAWGINNALPAVGDYDGDGKTDLTVYQNDPAGGDFNFFVLKSSDNSMLAHRWGQNLDIPVASFNQH
jgi:hypothetical protein